MSIGKNYSRQARIAKKAPVESHLRGFLMQRWVTFSAKNRGVRPISTLSCLKCEIAVFRVGHDSFGLAFDASLHFLLHKGVPWGI